MTKKGMIMIEQLYVSSLDDLLRETAIICLQCMTCSESSPYMFKTKNKSHSLLPQLRAVFVLDLVCFARFHSLQTTENAQAVYPQQSMIAGP